MMGGCLTPLVLTKFLKRTYSVLKEEIKLLSLWNSAMQAERKYETEKKTTLNQLNAGSQTLDPVILLFQQKLQNQKRILT